MGVGRVRGLVRVLHTVHAYPPDVGGTEAVVARLSQGLVERGHEVEVATKEHPERRGRVEGIPVHGFATNPAGVSRYRRFVNRGVSEDRWDVVMTYHSKVFTHLSLYPFGKVKDRWVYCPTEFTDVDSRAVRHRAYYRTVEPASLRKARRSIVLTEKDRERAVEIAGEEIRDRLRVIPNGVDHAWWGKGEEGNVRAALGVPEGVPLVVYAGGLWEHKDVRTLVAGLGRLRGVHLVVAGDRMGRGEELRRWAREVGAPNRVHFVGRLERERLRSLLHAADVFASASTNEGFGLVFLEAMACGLPVVAREVGVIGELLGKGAEVVVAEDANGFARGIESVLGDASKRNVEIARGYGWEGVVDAWLSVYEDLLG